MSQHQSFDLGVDPLAPDSGAKERPPDLRIIALFVFVDAELRRADDGVVGAINDHESALVHDGVLHEVYKHLFAPAIMDGVLLPHSRIAGDGVERVVIVFAQRAQKNALAFKGGLPIHAKPRQA